MNRLTRMHFGPVFTPTLRKEQQDEVRRLMGRLRSMPNEVAHLGQAGDWG